MTENCVLVIVMDYKKVYIDCKHFQQFVIFSGNLWIPFLIFLLFHISSFQKMIFSTLYFMLKEYIRSALNVSNLKFKNVLRT